jgi:hypothetical protein
MSASSRRKGVNPLPKARLIYLAVMACLVFAYLGAFLGSLGMSDGDI